MARVTIHTCDKCKREIDDEAEPYFVATIHQMPRDSKGAQNSFDFCVACMPLVAELMTTPIADDIERVEIDEEPLAADEDGDASDALPSSVKNRTD